MRTVGLGMVLRMCAIAVVATQLAPLTSAHAQTLTKGTVMNSLVSRLPGAEGRGSVSGVPTLPVGFADTFTSRFIDTGSVRLHAVIGGDGPPLLLIHGWPENWYAWRMVMPALAENFQVIAVDQRGMGLSDKPHDGYDTATLAHDMVAVMDTLGYQRFAVVGHDTGMLIAYALAADYPDRVTRLAVAETTIPGVAPSPPLFAPELQNNVFWHISFNRISKDSVNERLVAGREDIFFNFEFDTRTVKKLPPEVVQYYIDGFASDPDALRGSFEFYRALDTSSAQNEQRKARRLTMPVLAIGGGLSTGEAPANVMKLAADNVQGLVIPGVGHFVAEEAPEDMAVALNEFLASYRNEATVAALAV